MWLEPNDILQCTKFQKNEIFEIFGPLTKHGTHWINIIILTFISENNRYSKCLYKIWNEFISFDIIKREI
jgi:hypothetical protein